MDMEQKTGSKSGKEYIKAYIVTLFFILYVEYISSVYKFYNWTEVTGKVCAYTYTHTHTTKAMPLKRYQRVMVI